MPKNPRSLKEPRARTATHSFSARTVSPYRVVLAKETHQTRKITDYMQGSGTSYANARSALKRAESTGKPTESLTAPSSGLPSSQPSEYVEEISDSSNSEGEKYMSSGDEDDAIKREITAGSKNPAIQEKILDHLSSVCGSTLSSMPTRHIICGTDGQPASVLLASTVSALNPGFANANPGLNHH